MDRIFEPVKYTFTSSEIRALGEGLAREAQSLFDIRTAKTAAVASFGAQIKSAEERIGELTTKINSGFEYRDCECVFLLDQPVPGQKTLIRCDDSTPVRVEGMTIEEMQASFKFSEGG